MITVTFSFIRPTENIVQTWPAVPRSGEHIKLDDSHMGTVYSVWWSVTDGVIGAIVEVLR